MKVIKPLFGIALIGSAAYLAHLAYEGTHPMFKETKTPSERSATYSDQLKEKLLKYQKPVRIEVTNYIKDPKHPYQKEVESMKKIKVPQNPDGTYYVQIGFFVDETDPASPLVAQIVFLDLKTGNIIEESSLNFF